jgi:hypothetical protein
MNVTAAGKRVCLSHQSQTTVGIQLAARWPYVDDGKDQQAQAHTDAHVQC